MFRRARLSVKPNVRPGVGARSSAAANPQRGREAPRPPEPAASGDPKPAEITDVPPADSGRAKPPEEAPRSSNEKTDGKNDVEESSKSSSTVSQRRKRISSTPPLVKPSVNVPSVPHPLSTVNQEDPQPQPKPTKEKQPYSDRYRIYKAQKLREMLKEELRKEKKQWKNKYAINESQRPPDRSKMTMRDFIYYLPDSNPMTSSLEQEKKTEKSLTPVQTREQEDKSTPDVEDNEELEEEIDDGPLLVPRVKVAEDGSIILDEESLTVEVLRTKGPCVVEENDPIFERGSTTTYSSFRKNYYSKPWSNKETDMFFLAISMVGTDFSMIGQLFPHRERIEIKNKFKREEKTNGWRIDKAFQEKRPFDFDFFAHLLQKVLDEEEKRKQKSLKNQNLREKKSSKPRKNVKVKKVTSEGVTDNPDESMSAKISDTEDSQKDTQTVQEELQPPTLSGQDSEQIALEPDLNLEKRRKNQDEVGTQEVKNLSGNATVQPGPSKGEKQKSKCPFLRPEENEDEGNKEQKLSCVQTIDEVEDLSSRDKVVNKTDPVLSLSQQDATSVATEASESITSDLHSSEVGIRVLCEVNNAESSCTEERNVELKNISLEADQTENVKPMVRGRFQRPKPNLSRAVGKKSVLSQGKTDAKSKNLHPEPSVEKTHMEKDKMNSFDISGMENTEKENAEADTVSSLSEKMNLQEDNQPKAFRPARLRGRLQRPKPNVVKAAERKEILASKEEIGANVEKNENESCVDINTPEQIEDQSCDITSQSGKKDTSFQNVQSDEPKSLNECSSIQEDNEANILRQVPVLKSRFQKPKPNIGRRTGRRDISSKEELPEEIVVSGKKAAARLEISSKEKVPVEASTTKEIESKLKETGRRDISLREKKPEMIDFTMETVTDLKETGREISLREKILEVTGAIEERETDFEGIEKREISTQEKAPEVNTVGEAEAGMKEPGREISLREERPEVTMTDATEEREMDLEETRRREISTQEKAPEDRVTGEVEADLKEIGKETFSREKISAVGEMVAGLEKTEKIDISLKENEPEETGTSLQIDTDLMQSRSADCSAVPSLNIKNISNEVLSVVHTPVEEKGNTEKEVSSQLSHWKTSLKTSELDKTEDQGTPSADVPEQFSDINLSKSLPQEQKPFKPAPFMRSRFKRPKPNLSRATLKRETMEAEKHVPGKKLEMDKIETIMIQQDGEQMNTLPSQSDASSLMTSKERDRSDHRQEEAGMLPCELIEKNLSPSSVCESEEASQSTQAQEKELPVSIGNHNNINTFQQEMKESIIHTTRPVRGRLQRPRPNIKKAGHRQMEEKGEAEGIVEKERTKLQKDETEKKLLNVPNYQIGTEIEDMSSKVSEGRMYENQSHVTLLENLHINKIDVLDKKMRNEQKTCVSSPAQLIRRQFQNPEPNLGRAHDKKEERVIEKDRADPGEAWRPEDNLLQQGDSDIQLLQKEKAELLTSVEVSARKDCVGSEEAGLAKKDLQSEVGPSGSVGQKTEGDNSVSPVVEEQHLSKLARTAISSASGYEMDHTERRMHRKIKPTVNKGRGSKRIRSKTSKKEPRAPKAMLVTLRASQEEDEDDGEDFESVYEEESYHLAPEEINKAPVFVPVGLRSPEPVSTHIEETMEELEITVNVPDIGFITVDEHQLSNTDVTTQEMKQEENLNVLSVEMTTGEHTQDETDTNDGSTEAAITLLTMGDLVLQSEISTEQSDGICVLPGVHSKDKSHIPFNPDNVSDKIVYEYQELSSPVSSIPLSSLEENKIELEEQSTKEEIGFMEKVKENARSTRNTTSEVTNNLRMRRRFAKPKPNLKILRTNRFGAHQEVPNLLVTKGEVEIQRETEKNAPKATGLEDKNLESETIAENKEQSRLEHDHAIEETSILQEASLKGRKEDQAQGSQEIQILSFAPVVSSETSSHTLGLGQGLSESSVGEPLAKDSSGDNVLTSYVPECIPTNIPEVQQENVSNPQDLAVNLIGNIHHDAEEEQAFILTLVEIPTNAVEEFTDNATQLMPNPLLPAPILVKSVTTEEKGDMSMNFPITSVDQDAMCFSNSGRDASEKPPTNLDLMSRKRLHCRSDESDHVPPAKKHSLTLRSDCQEYTSEVCSKELINVFEETGMSYKGQSIFPTSESTHTTPEPQKEQLEETFQSMGSRPLDKIIDTHIEKNSSLLPQDKVVVSDKKEGTCAASKSEQVDCITSSSKPPLSRPGRRPLGFLSLICSKNNLESDEPTQVHRKKRLKPLIPISRQNLKRSNPLSESQKKVQESSDMHPSPSVNTQSEDIGNSATQVSCDPSLPKEECKSAHNQALEEESDTVSEYFFSDIFIEVDKTE
uniref:B double prime 1, subunit of RNA polymerase III transcription initiation factor IIIB n=1 Tax=Pipistrellus kuhlii TaxID=59472 RepID=A0A7J7YUV4_PIPKU|nr:B double prime 1, subunit of RNA polymerase III transcription initiation factor IIIB [Pipistrellus kuhlii]